MDNMPKVSVIVPIYNVEKYLKRCMDSLLNQTLRDIEIIMVDDGSLDNCPQLCDEYAEQDDRIKVIHKINRGLGFARNSGIEAAAGEFIAFVDSDDFVDINMYKTLYQTAKEHNLDTIFCSLNFYKDEQHITQRKEVDIFTMFRGRKEVDSFLLDYIGPEPSYPRNTKFIKSACKALYSLDLIKNNTIQFYSEKQIASEDVLFHIDYLSKASFVGFLPEYHYFYFYNNSSITKIISKDKIERIKLMLTEVNKKLNDCFPESVYKIHYYRLMLASFNIILKMEIQLNKKDVNNVLLRCCKDDFFSDLFTTYPINKLFITHKLFYGCVKYQYIWLLRIMLKLKLV
jgi:glycosyltransferase involved in cell wall biosynthesis